MKYPISISMNIAGHRSSHELMRRLAAAGFDGLDFDFYSRWGQVAASGQAEIDRWADGLAASAAEAGLKWFLGHGPFFNVLGTRAEDDAGRRACSAALGVFGRIGIPWMVLHPGAAPGGGDGSHRRAMIDGNAAFIRTLLGHCERVGVGIALENVPPEAVPYRFAQLPQDLLELADAVNHPLVGLCWDTGHGRIMNVDQRAAVTAIGSRLKVLHLQENDGAGDDHMLPYASTRKGVDWAGLMAGLRDIGYSGALNYEVDAAFCRLPEELYDATLRHAVTIARYLASLG
jgi:sugar phosphate isomerase/epimerase